MTVSKNAAWLLFWREEKDCWVLKYKAADGSWPQKHLPRDFRREDGPKKRRKGARMKAQTQLPLTRAEVWATEWLENAESLNLRPRARPGGLVLRDAYVRWLAMRELDEARTSPATVRRFKGDFKNILRPFGPDKQSIGEEYVVSIGTDLGLLRRWFRALTGRLSPWRSRSAFSTLRSFFDDALVEKWVRGVNPMKNEALIREQPELPTKADRGGVKLIETETVQHIILHPNVPMARAVRYALAATSGLREGELSGLAWGDLHIEDDVPTPHMDVARARRLIRKKNEVLGPLKTATSRGVLPLHPAAVAALLEWRDDEDNGIALLLDHMPRPEDPVFPAENPAFGAGFSRPRSARKLRVDLQAAGLPPSDSKGRPLDMKAFRKAFGTSLRRLKVSEPIRKALMRHGARDVTEDFYTENLPEMAEAVGRIPLEWALVARVVPTVVPGATTVDEKPSNNESRESGLNRRPALYESTQAARSTVPDGDQKTAYAALDQGRTVLPGTGGSQGSGPGSVPATKGSGAAGPGVKRVSRGAKGVRVEVDGRRVARAEAAEGEPIAELEERLKAAVGRAKGGLQ